MCPISNGGELKCCVLIWNGGEIASCACVNDCHKLLRFHKVLRLVRYDLPSIVKSPLVLFADDAKIHISLNSVR